MSIKGGFATIFWHARTKPRTLYDKMYRDVLVKGVLIAFAMMGSVSTSTNSTYENPILPGFHPDPSCIYVPEWNETFFCASSSFNAFPGIPIHASKDLQNWKLIGR